MTSVGPPEVPGPNDSFDPRPAGLADRLDDVVVWFERHRHRLSPVVLVLLAVGVVAVGLVWIGRSADRPPVEDLIPRAVSSQPSTTPTATTLPAPPAAVVVYLTGAVVNPGVYVLAEGDRIIDALQAAGGARPDAELAAVNLAAPLIDGSQIRIPVPGEELSAPVTTLGAGGSGPGGAAGAGGAEAGRPVDLNTADAVGLQSLPGVGPATAEAIIAWREDRGGFATVEQLLDVPGIGPAKFAQLQPLVVVG